jgi:hypothetical protein
MLLSVALLNLTTSSVWNIKKTIFGENNYYISNETGEDILKVYYPRGSSSPSKIPVGGVGFYLTPNEISNATDVTLSYSVKFDKTFKPTLGGKLPGLFVNKNNNYFGGSGGKHTNNTSCRIAWRSDFDVEAYVYLPKTIQQSEDYYQNSIQNKIYGDSVWRGHFKFDNTSWNNVTLRIRLNTFNNTFPNNDGILEMSINNINRSLHDIILTTDPDNRVETVIFETFFGGSSPKAVTPNDTWTYFKDVVINKNL